MGRWLMSLGAALLVVACRGQPPGPTVLAVPSATPPPAPPAAPTPAPPAAHVSDWRMLATGASPPGWRDPGRDSLLPWLFSGRWAIGEVRSSGYTGRAWQAQEEHPQPYLSFRVWQGSALGNRYTFDVTVQPVSSPHFKAPVGEIALIPYYVDPTHYLEVILTAEHLGIWVADGGSPGRDQGWRGLRFQPVRTAAGQLRRVTMAVDLDAQRVTVGCDGQTWSVTDDFLRYRPHTVALRSVGNRFNILAYRIAGR